MEACQHAPIGNESDMVEETGCDVAGDMTEKMQERWAEIRTQNA